MKPLLVLPILAVVLLSGCIGQNSSGTPVAEQAKQACIALCLQEQQNKDLSDGPCLSNNIAAGWVCDVAHNPRQDVDNDPVNQCPAFGSSAQHFVEVDSECNFIISV